MTAALPGLLALAAPLVIAGCATRSATWEASWGAPYAAFDPDEQADFAGARAMLDGGQRLSALAALRDLAAADEGNLELASWVQDVESDLLQDGVPAGELFPALRAGERLAASRDLAPEDGLRLVYADRAEESPTVQALILAARVETDGMAAESLLRRALELDPVCSWAHYGLAHVLLEKRSQPDRWSLARASLQRALEIEPGNLRARRLEAWMLAEEGSRDVAETQLRRWLEESAGDPRVSGAERVEAQLDLALLLLLRGEDRRAARLLEDLEGEPTGRARRWMLLTVARQEGGDLLGALDATLRAQGAAAGEVLPLVQEALLSEAFLDRPEQASALWEEVAALAGDGTSITDLVQGLRARVRMERALSAAEESP
ncbi:MAG: hypothetical protein ISQ11_12765 [Planctomycetes bacterium]|nr:hypothetical protein [Planctomycetota bacterium]